MSSDPTPFSRSLTAMLKILKEFLPPLFQPPPPPPPPVLPPSTVVLASVVERTVGLGSRVGTDLRGPFTVAALKGLRIEAVARYEIWAQTPAEVGQAIEDLITKLLGERESLRAKGFLRVALKNTGSGENIFSEDAWRQTVDFEVLFEFPYVDSDEAESLIARIPININSEINETTLVVDEMTRWDQTSAPLLEVRGPVRIGAVTALSFVKADVPSGEITILRTFDGAPGAPTNHATLPAFVSAVGGDNPAERHAQVTFASLTQFLAALASFEITDRALAAMRADGVPDAVADQLEVLKGQEIGGEDPFVALLQATIGNTDTNTFKSKIMKHAANLQPMNLGDWDEDENVDEYKSVRSVIAPPIALTALDRFEIGFEHPQFDKVAVVYIRATR